MISRMAQPNSSPHRWLIDSGCGFDIVGLESFRRRYLNKHAKLLDRPLRIQTANGLVTHDHDVPAVVNSIGVGVRAVFGGDTHDMLSLGVRCRDLVSSGFHNPFLMLCALSLRSSAGSCDTILIHRANFVSWR